jgi:hypothetical protein
MAVIKSGVSTDELVIDPTSKAARVTLYNSDGSLSGDTDPVSLVVNNVTAANNDLIAAFDASAFKFVSLQLTGTWVGEVRFQASSDLGTWFDVVTQNVSELFTPYIIKLDTISGVKIPIMFKYLRVRVTQYTSGIVSGVADGHREDTHTGQISAVGEVTFATPTTLTNYLFIADGGNVDVNSINISSSSSVLKSLVVTNNVATTRILKVYNTSSTPTAGVGTPVFVVSIPASGIIVYPVSQEGQFFSNGIGITMTLGIANDDTTPTATVGDMTAVFQYK